MSFITQRLSKLRLSKLANVHWYCDLVNIVKIILENSRVASDL